MTPAQLLCDRVFDVGDLALRYGLVTRATFHHDGVTPESDTTHVVMLQLALLELWTLRPGDYDLGRLLAFAVVHDLCEIEVGDTNSFGIGADAKQKKELREAQALRTLCDRYAEHGFLPWLLQYERQDTPEARAVRVMDKVLPKVTHTKNRGAAFLRMLPVPNQQGVREVHDRQIQALAKTYPERSMGLLHQVLSLACDRAVDAYESPSLSDLQATVDNIVPTLFDGLFPSLVEDTGGAGFCYEASAALCRALGKGDVVEVSGLEPLAQWPSGEVHWVAVIDGWIVDLTARQFNASHPFPLYAPARITKESERVK